MSCKEIIKTDAYIVRLKLAFLGHHSSLLDGELCSVSLQPQLEMVWPFWNGIECLPGNHALRKQRLNGKEIA